METVRKINDEFAIAGPMALSQWQQVAEEGFKSVLNLRSLNHLLSNEQQQVEHLGLCYVNLPVDAEVMNPEIAVRVLSQISQLPKPALVCCNNATLAAAMVFMHIAIHQGQPLQQAFQRAEALGLFKTYSQPAPLG
ncbi:phosphatase (plasmid) [Kovacikia minuta CCNUW1]|uniref:beta-lactamase hydrolase domain-containing protein n=1 Tax=Kovacikia minuta TaxID=2931930 RepID=UPI001CCD12A0|nr:sulfur transferase domain-containing protein [Kovacikia minuta]UBF30625.1 phosphatase [Kovacikia minuta CCNUW1]